MLLNKLLDNSFPTHLEFALIYLHFRGIIRIEIIAQTHFLEMDKGNMIPCLIYIMFKLQIWHFLQS